MTFHLYVFDQVDIGTLCIHMFDYPEMRICKVNIYVCRAYIAWEEKALILTKKRAR